VSGQRRLAQMEAVLLALPYGERLEVAEMARHIRSLGPGRLASLAVAMVDAELQVAVERLPEWPGRERERGGGLDSLRSPAAGASVEGRAGA